MSILLLFSCSHCRCRIEYLPLQAKLWKKGRTPWLCNPRCPALPQGYSTVMSPIRAGLDPNLGVLLVPKQFFGSFQPGQEKYNLSRCPDSLLHYQSVGLNCGEVTVGLRVFCSEGLLGSLISTNRMRNSCPFLLSEVDINYCRASLTFSIQPFPHFNFQNSYLPKKK